MKNKQKLLLCIMGLIIPALNAGYIPWFVGSDGNPYSDENGDNWSVHQITTAAGGVNYRDFSQYTAMGWNSDNNRWEGNDMNYGHPYYDSNIRLTAVGAGSGKWRQSAIVFDPANVGSYSWTGDLYYLDQSGNSVSSGIEFGKFDSLGNWVSLYAVELAHNSALDLGSISELQNIIVNTGEVLVLALQTTITGFHAAATVDFARNGYEAVSIVPEPATLGLLLVGSVFIRKARKSYSS